MNTHWHSFESALSIGEEDLASILYGYSPIAWLDFLLNPRRLRGSDFLMRWSQGVWSEERVVQAVNETGEFFALPYGPSGTAPDDDVQQYELYFERLENAGLGNVKRPDLLIFAKSEEKKVKDIVERLGGISELPFTLEQNPEMRELLSTAILAVECENSLWKARQMPQFGSSLKPQRRLGGRPGLAKSAVLPTVIIKEEDRTPLRGWQEQAGVKIHIWHVFYDMAFGISLDAVEELIGSGLIEPTVQTFQAPGGATTKKVLYKIYYHYAYPLGEARGEPKLVAASRIDPNGHILPYVRFEGGTLALGSEALRTLKEAHSDADNR